VNCTYSKVIMRFVVAFLAVLAVGSVSATPLLDNLLAPVVSSLAPVTSAVGGIVTRTLDKFSSTINRLPGPLLECADKLVGAACDALTSIVNQISKLPALDTEFIQTLTSQTDIIGASLKNIVQCVEGIVNADVVANVTDLVTQLEPYLKNLLCTIQCMILDVVAEIRKLLNKVSKAVDKSLGEVQIALRSIVDVVFETMNFVLRKLQSELPSDSSELITDLLIKLIKIGDGIVTNARSAKKTLFDDLDKLLVSVQSTMNILGLQCSQQ